MCLTNSDAAAHGRVVYAGLGLVACLSLGAAASELSESRERALALIQPQLIKAHVQFLAHDLLEGRDTGERGYEIAREYVASQFVRIGAQSMADGTHIQPFELLVGGADRGSRLSVAGLTIEAPDAAFMPDWLAREPVLVGEGIYVGQGLVDDDRDDYRGAEQVRVDVRDKIVFMIPGVPEDWADHPTRGLLERTKIQVALARGARAVVMLKPESTDAPARPRPMVLADGTSPSPRAEVSVGAEATARLLGAWHIASSDAVALAERGMPARLLGSVSISRARNISRVWSWNVVGVVPGSDPVLRDEAVVFTAHLDHVGMGSPDEDGDRIYNGAHDNALGIGKMLASAEAMARAPAKRSTVFLAVGAEERGLLGAWYYVKHPVFPIAHTVAALNHDGGLEGAATDDFFAFGLEFTTLAAALDRAATASDMTMSRDYRPPFATSQSLMFRSDQYAFLAAGVPAVYLMDGFTIAGDPERGRLHWDAYLTNVNHQLADNYDPTWTFESPARMAVLSVRAAWVLGDANRSPEMVPNDWFPTSRGVPADASDRAW